VYLREGKIPENKLQICTEPLLDFLDDRIRLPAVGTLIIAIFEKRNLSIGRSLNVISRLADRKL